MFPNIEASLTNTKLTYRGPITARRALPDKQSHRRRVGDVLESVLGVVAALADVSGLSSRSWQSGRQHVARTQPETPVRKNKIHVRKPSQV